MSDTQPNTELLKDVQRNNEKAVRRLFDLHYNSLCYFAESITGDRPASEDIALDTFMKFLQGSRNFQTLAAVKSFLFTTVRHASIDHLRKEKRHQSAHQEIAHLRSQEPPEDPKMISAMVLQAVYEEVENLPPQCKAVFRQLFYEGKKTADVAADLGLSPQTVLNQKAKAIRHLQHFLLQKGYLDSFLLVAILQAILAGQHQPVSA